LEGSGVVLEKREHHFASSMRDAQKGFLEKVKRHPDGALFFIGSFNLPGKLRRRLSGVYSLGGAG
jgi:NMD protein affecting ribosome stability and mRNA decay